MSNIKSIINNKTVWIDVVFPELIKEGGVTILEQLCILLDSCVHQTNIPEEWNNLLTVLLYKKSREIIGSYPY